MSTKKAAFYLLQDTAISALKTRDLYLCRLAEKAYQNKHKVYIYTSSSTESETLDTQLWTFRDISFVPHKIYRSNSESSQNPESSLPPVLISAEQPPAAYQEVLINLTATIPTFFANFSHIIEIAPNDENLRQIARTHYKHYQQQGYEVITHKID